MFDFQKKLKKRKTKEEKWEEKKVKKNKKYDKLFLYTFSNSFHLFLLII